MCTTEVIISSRFIAHFLNRTNISPPLSEATFRSDFLNSLCKLVIMTYKIVSDEQKKYNLKRKQQKENFEKSLEDSTHIPQSFLYDKEVIFLLGTIDTIIQILKEKELSTSEHKQLISYSKELLEIVS